MIFENQDLGEVMGRQSGARNGSMNTLKAEKKDDGSKLTMKVCRCAIRSMKPADGNS